LIENHTELNVALKTTPKSAGLYSATQSDARHTTATYARSDPIKKHSAKDSLTDQQTRKSTKNEPKHP